MATEGEVAEDGGRPSGAGKDAVVAQMRLFAALIASHGLELALSVPFLGLSMGLSLELLVHFGQSKSGVVVVFVGR